MAQGQKPFYLALGAVVVVGAVLIALKFTGGAPTSIAANADILPADTSGFRGYVMGSDSAPVEIIEYGDMECPACQSFAIMQFPDVERRLIQTGKARFRFRDFPLDDIHKHPRIAAHAAACGDAQGKYWQTMHDIYARQSEWSAKANPMGILEEVAGAVGLDVGKWSDCMSAGTYAGRIQASFLEGNTVGVSSTPSFVIGGRVFSNMSSDQMVRIVDSIIATKTTTTP